MSRHISVTLPLSNSFLDYPDNESLAVVVYTCGCDHYCPGCQNQKLISRSIGTEMKEDELEAWVYSDLYSCKTNKLVISGGDPLHPENIDVVKDFLLKNQHKIDICIYTGYDIEYVKMNNVTGYKFIKCGKYDSRCKQTSEKTDTRLVLASSNQKLYNSKGQLVSKHGMYYFGGRKWISKLKLAAQKVIKRINRKQEQLLELFLKQFMR